MLTEAKDIAMGLAFIAIVVLFSLMCIGIGEWCTGVVYRMGFTSLAAGSVAFLVGLGINLVVVASVVDRVANARWWWK
jgi:hypothetical protein